MESLLEQVKAMYDLVVIDTPPLTAVSDAFPLLKKVDGVVIVGRVGRNCRDVAERLHETLTGAGAPLLGVIANGFKSGRRGGGTGMGTVTTTRPPSPSRLPTRPPRRTVRRLPRRRRCLLPAAESWGSDAGSDAPRQWAWE